ncbi:hypothetical protein ACVWZK_006646 [Bradyrhizobium sp. GM0.4]
MLNQKASVLDRGTEPLLPEEADSGWSDASARGAWLWPTAGAWTPPVLNQFGISLNADQAVGGPNPLSRGNCGYQRWSGGNCIAVAWRLRQDAGPRYPAIPIEVGRSALEFGKSVGSPQRRGPGVLIRARPSGGAGIIEHRHQSLDQFERRLRSIRFRGTLDPTAHGAIHRVRAPAQCGCGNGRPASVSLQIGGSIIHVFDVE